MDCEWRWNLCRKNNGVFSQAKAEGSCGGAGLQSAGPSGPNRAREPPATRLTTRLFPRKLSRSIRRIGPIRRGWRRRVKCEILSAIGAGGMGEVYQAHDIKRGRDVAIKVLPEAFAHDPERLARFQREAKMLASLNHPNIAMIHGLEQSGDTNYLVMELVSGETLAERIKREGAFPIEEALKIGIQIADALEAAHEK